MTIAKICYFFYDDKVSIHKPREITKETAKYYWIKEDGYTMSYLKSEIGKIIVRRGVETPYVELIMIDSSEEELRDILSKWFQDNACRIWRMSDRDNNVIV